MNALDICNACDVNEMDPDSPAGYCAECEAEARSQSGGSPIAADLAAVIQPVIDAWMDGDHGGVIYTKELTDLIVEALTRTHPVVLYNAGYAAGRRAAS